MFELPWPPSCLLRLVSSSIASFIMEFLGTHPLPDLEADKTARHERHFGCSLVPGWRIILEFCEARGLKGMGRHTLRRLQSHEGKACVLSSDIWQEEMDG